jgi:GT2 family glycosyltransferase
MSPKVYIILVNHNGWKDTIECLESLLNLRYDNWQVIIVDNSTGDESINKINEWATIGLPIQTVFSDLIPSPHKKPFDDLITLRENQMGDKVYEEKILVIKAVENNGFSAANNVALKYAMRCNDFEFAWILNNDTVVASDSLSALEESMRQKGNENVGIAGSKVMEYESRTTIQSAGGGRLIKPLAYSTLNGAAQKDIGQFDHDYIEMDFVAGTSMLVRKQFLTEVGLLSEDYFLYFEEADWAERGYPFGWRLGYCYRSLVFHKGGASTGGKGYSSGQKSSTAFSDYYFQRAKVLFTKKYYRHWLPVLYLSFSFVIFNRIRRAQFDRLKLLLSILVHPSKPYPGHLKT